MNSWNNILLEIWIHALVIHLSMAILFIQIFPQYAVTPIGHPCIFSYDQTSWVILSSVTLQILNEQTAFINLNHPSRWVDNLLKQWWPTICNSPQFHSIQCMSSCNLALCTVSCYQILKVDPQINNLFDISCQKSLISYTDDMYCDLCVT